MVSIALVGFTCKHVVCAEVVNDLEMSSGTSHIYSDVIFSENCAGSGICRVCVD